MLKGTKHSEETKAKLSAASKGRQHTPEDRAKQSLAQMGHIMSIETRAKIGAAQKGRTASSETRAKLSAAHIGNKHSFASRAKISAALKGRIISPETRAKRSIAFKGRMISSEQRAKISAALKGYKHTPEARANMSTARKSHVMACGGNCNSVGCTSPKSPTRIENILANVLLAEFPEVRREEHFGHYWVDAYLPPPYHLAFEADGVYWHRADSKQSKKDAKRDAYLIMEYGLPVVRIGERELLAMEV